MEANTGATLIYVSDQLSCKPRNDFTICKTSELKSTFIEIGIRKEVVISGCIFEYSNMNINEFKDDYLNEILDKLFKESLDDFNINLLNYHIHSPTNGFLDSPSSHYFLHLIFQLTRVKSNSKKLLDNIFSNLVLPNI